MRQKHYWEIRIRELGGSDYKNTKRQFLDVDGKELPGAPNYKYYGVAKDLPGVRELFAELEESAERKRMQRKRGDLYKNITPDYYGYRDDDDGVLEPLEAEREVGGWVYAYTYVYIYVCISVYMYICGCVGREIIWIVVVCVMCHVCVLTGGRSGS